ncbi:PREDICTED: matrilysin-like [Priapulus caudatus]|uniref:Matrilysin-like n=1 Tax=Priapulus caudatus TaxID=37621 RepID=A0ABM1DYV2_PRICU|nr:PREDICTED: matrilysin-like [Priapulus caudatus]
MTTFQTLKMCGAFSLSYLLKDCSLARLNHKKVNNETFLHLFDCVSRVVGDCQPKSVTLRTVIKKSHPNFGMKAPGPYYYQVKPNFQESESVSCVSNKSIDLKTPKLKLFEKIAEICENPFSGSRGFFTRWWERCELTWQLVNGTEKINNYYVRRVLAQALSQWENAVNEGRRYPVLTFRETRGHRPDIRFGFNYGDHGDVLPFDGPGPSVAHSFFPYISNEFNGHVHFDEYEDWSLGSNVGHLFPLIALHELGHVLGLPHTSDPSAVMYPILDKRSISSWHLQRADVQAIQALYPYRLCDFGPFGFYNKRKR